MSQRTSPPERTVTASKNMNGTTFVNHPAEINPALSAHTGAAEQSVQHLAAQVGHLDSAQILTLLRHLPGFFNKLSEDGSLKEDLQRIAAASNTFQPTSLPDGPPPPLVEQSHTEHFSPELGDAQFSNMSEPPPSPDSRNSKKKPEQGTEEWQRLRKDNHKEVERRRRGNINEGINELARIVPNGAGEKVAKGAVLSRAVQYIHHLKDNEARNIEKWTLEKLLMDQAMGDSQVQLEDMRRMYEEERALNARL
ncbi:HLH-domain-containing protein, partial [Sistotremastrum suecicum HHB10207 ss-3]